VELLTTAEAWVEGIRVDPDVRGQDVATDLVRACLELAARQGGRVVRWMTGERNVGSVRLGARLDMHVLGAWRFHGRTAEEAQEPASGRERVVALLARARERGLVLPPDADAGSWLARLARDPTFQAGHGLVEHRRWAVQALTADLMRDLLAAGDVMAFADGDRWALLVLNLEASLEAGDARTALLAGDGTAAMELLRTLGGADGPLRQLRLPDDAPLLRGHEAAFRELGYLPHEGRTLFLEGPLG
jgi:GNAT superfamily N-acetyltransferase